MDEVQTPQVEPYAFYDRDSSIYQQLRGDKNYFNEEFTPTFTTRQLVRGIKPFFCLDSKHLFEELPKLEKFAKNMYLYEHIKVNRKDKVAVISYNTRRVEYYGYDFKPLCNLKELPAEVFISAMESVTNPSLDILELCLNRHKWITKAIKEITSSYSINLLEHFHKKGYEILI